MRILPLVLLAAMLGGCAAAPMVLSGIGGGLVIAKDVVGLDIQLVDLKKAIDAPNCPAR